MTQGTEPLRAGSVPPTNSDARVVAGFGEEWSYFDQRRLSDAEARTLFENYFAIFPWERLQRGAEGFDLGCGSGRWARFVAERVGRLHCIDPSKEALDGAGRLLVDSPNCVFHHATVENAGLHDASQDFGYSLGVLHHVPDTEAALTAAAAKLRPGAPFLVYLYYRFDNRPVWYRAIWRVSDLLRRVICGLPLGLKRASTAILAALVYWPLARGARCIERLGLNPSSLPLADYRTRSFFVMRTDAYDRFATRLEKRFTRAEITKMMANAGLEDLVFSDAPPYWCCVGLRKR